MRRAFWNTTGRCWYIADRCAGRKPRWRSAFRRGKASFGILARAAAQRRSDFAEGRRAEPSAPGIASASAGSLHGRMMHRPATMVILDIQPIIRQIQHCLIATWIKRTKRLILKWNIALARVR